MVKHDYHLNYLLLKSYNIINQNNLILGVEYTKSISVHE